VTASAKDLRDRREYIPVAWRKNVDAGAIGVLSVPRSGVERLGIVIGEMFPEPQKQGRFCGSLQGRIYSGRETSPR
jgi:hypothetical protein